MISNADHDHPPNDPVLPLVSNDLWQAIFRHLDINANEVALVSKQFLAAWRAGVVGVYVHIPKAHALGFLLEDRFNSFPNLRFVDLSDNSTYVQRMPGAREVALARPGISLQLKLTSRVHLGEVVAFFARYPRWAAAVTQVAVFAGNKEFAQAWALIRLLPNLVGLRLSGFADLTDDHLRALCCLPSLRQLAVLMSPRFTGEGLNAMADPDCGIESLELRHCALSGDQLHHLSNNPRLQRLMLACCRRIQPQDLFHLHSLPALKVLSVRENALLDNAALKLLAEQLPQLEVLDIGYCGSIDDEGIAELARLQQLNYLSLLGCCRFSEQAVHQLAAKLPALTEIAAHRLLNTTGEAMGVPRNAKGQAVAMTSMPREL